MKGLTQEIQAKIHPDALERVTRFFGGGAAQIMSELFQNARRAGAERVEIWSGEERTTIADDGIGIDDPARILSFGESEWTNETTRAEDPAGMGMYALARRRSRIESHSASGSWVMDLEPECFTGQKSARATALSDASGQFGTRVTIEHDDEGFGKELPGAARRAALYFPLEVRINGLVAEQKDFLETAVRVEEWNGVRIGVYDGQTRNCPRINFHGRLIDGGELPEVATMTVPWTCQVDVVDAPELQLELPARHRVVENVYLKKLQGEALKAIYWALAMPDAPDVPYATRNEAKAAGVLLRIPKPMLRSWSAKPADPWGPDAIRGYNEPTPIDPDGLIMEAAAKRSAGDNCVLERALELRQAAQPEDPHQTYTPIVVYEGYDWYDRMQRLSSYRIEVVDEHRRVDLEELRAEDNVPELGTIEKLQVRLEMTDPKSGTRTIERLDVDVAFGTDSEDYQDPEDLDIMTVGTTLTSWELAMMIRKGFFHSSDGEDAESYSTQVQEFENNAHRVATELLEGEEKALIEALQKAISRHVEPLLNSRTASFDVCPGEPPVVRLTPAPKAPAAEKGQASP